MERPMKIPIGRPMGRLIGRPMGRLMGRPMGRLMGRPMGIPMGRPMGRHVEIRRPAQQVTACESYSVTVSPTTT